MKEYKEYMDRIQVDDAQHERFLKALQEAGQPAQAETVSEKKKNRLFPLSPRLLRIGGLSAAAVVTLALLLGPVLSGGGQREISDSARTELTTQTGSRPEATTKKPQPVADLSREEAMAPVIAENPENPKNTEEVPCATQINGQPDHLPQMPVLEPAGADGKYNSYTGTIEGKTEFLLCSVWNWCEFINILNESEAEKAAEWIRQGVLKPASAVTSEATEEQTAASEGVFLQTPDGLSYVFDLSDCGSETEDEVRKFLSQYGLTLAE